jgi:predicted DsbA family dithiol-disulfide isomerase
MSTRLDIISDPICPWCYIGKTRLDAALAERPDHPFLITWRPFQLNPDMPKEGMGRREYLEGKFGGPEGATRIYGQIEDAAKAAGLDVDFSKMLRTPNTIDAHRLLRWAAIEGRQAVVANQLFHRYFKLGQDIGARDVLIDIAKTAGMDAEVTARLLHSDADLAETRAEDEQARGMGVTGVPTFLIGGKYVVTGAQDSATWIKIIDELTEMTAKMASEQQVRP